MRIVIVCAAFVVAFAGSAEASVTPYYSGEMASAWRGLSPQAWWNIPKKWWRLPALTSPQAPAPTDPVPVQYRAPDLELKGWQPIPLRPWPK